ncbi:MAG: flippase [Planctomycetes bacterium]|nr:flippase [Planctomycetota bacterium]
MESTLISKKAPAGTHARRVTRNAAFLFAGHVLSKIANFAFVVGFIRLLGEEEMGKLGVVMSASMILDTVIDWGLNGYSLCRLSCAPSEARQVASNVIALKTILSALALPILGGVIWRLGYPPLLTFALCLVPAITLLNAWASMFEVMLQVAERMEFRALLAALTAIIFSAAGLTCAFLARSFVGAVFVAIAVGAIRLILSYRFARPFIGRLSFGAVDTSRWLEMLRTSFPYAALLAMGVIYFRIDHLMLSKLSGLDATGAYYAVYRVLECFILLPRLLLDAAMPYLIRSHAGGGDVPRFAFEKMLKLFFLGVGPLAIGIAFFSGDIVRICYGEGLAPAAPTLAVLGIAIFVFSLTSLGSTFMVSALKVRVVAWILLGAVVLNIALNAILIPRWGHLGAARATLATEVFFLVAQFAYIFATRLPARVLAAAAKPAAGLALLAACLWGLEGQGRILAASIGAAAFIAFHGVARTLAADDRALILRALGRTRRAP